MPQNLNSASKKTLQQNRLQNLDTLGTDISQVAFEESLNVMEVACADFVDRVQKNIEDEGMIVTGKIMDISLEKTGNGVDIYAPEHLIYQDKGVNGTEQKLYNTPFSYKDKMPPINVIKEWIKNKSIVIQSPGSKGKSEEELTDSQAYAIAKSIQKKGIPPRNIFEKEIDQLVTDLQESLGDLYGNIIVETIPDEITLGKKS